MSESPLPVIRIAILGCGNVGAALVELLADPAGAEDLASRTGARLEVVGVAVSDVTKARPTAPHLAIDLLTDDAVGLVSRDDVDLVVELIGGLEPAGSLIVAARGTRRCLPFRASSSARSPPPTAPILASRRPWAGSSP